jgi:exosortase A-associated hydrolase 1
MLNVTERAIWIDGPQGAMLGVLSECSDTAQRQGVGLLIVSGGAQYRAGAHRQFATLARTLADQGFAVLRFDLPGVGDSPGEPLAFEASAPSVAAAIDALQAQVPYAPRVALWGLCDGASACLLHQDERADERVAGMALLNPWVRSEQTLAAAHLKLYYRDRLRQRDFWRKLARGGVGLQAIRELAQTVRRRLSPPAAPLPFQARMARAWLAFDKPVLLLLSEKDITAREFDEALTDRAVWGDGAQRPNVQRVNLSGADHTLSDPSAALVMQSHTLRWLAQLG